MTQFKGRRIKYTNEQLTQILDPLFEQKTPYNVIMTLTRLSHDTINKWAKEVKGMSANKLYKQSILCHSIDRQIKCKNDTNAKKSTQLQIKLQDNVPRMIQEDYTLEAMAEEIGCCHTCVSNWIIKTYNKTLTQIRQENYPNGYLTKLQVKMRDNIPRMIQEDYTLEAMAKELGCVPAYVSNWIIKTYNKTLTQIRQENNIK